MFDSYDIVNRTVDRLEGDLHSVKAEVLALRTAVSAKDKRVTCLEEELKATEEKLSIERKDKEELSQSLHAKADTIANLMTQLHKEKQKSRRVIEQLKLYGDSTVEQTSLRKVPGSAVSNMTVKYPSNHHSSESSSMTPPLRRMPHPPTTPPPTSVNHIRRASTPSKQFSSATRQGSSSRRRLPTVPQSTTFAGKSSEVTGHLTESRPIISSNQTSLNPLKKEEAPGYRDIVGNLEEHQVRPPTQGKQLSVLPPIEGDADAKVDSFEEDGGSVYVHRVKHQQALGSPKVSQQVRLDPHEQQAWIKQLPPQTDSQ